MVSVALIDPFLPIYLRIELFLVLTNGVDGLVVESLQNLAAFGAQDNGEETEALDPQQT